MRPCFAALVSALDNVETEADGFDRALQMCRDVRAAKGSVYFIGNGGSAAIASHMAADFGKNGRFRALCFNDGAALTCLGNDLGYEFVFADPLSRYCSYGDLLVAVSSSGQSENIIEGVWAAKRCGAEVITLSGFDADNPLRIEGKVNFYVPAQEYGTVEIAHLAILHSILDRLTPP